MPDRFFLALIVAATCWSLSTQGNAQVGLQGMRAPLSAGPSQGAPSGPEVRAAQPPGAYSALPNYGESSTAIADPSRKLQAGDQLLLKIEQDHEGAMAVLVSTTGEVVVDPIPQTIRVSGLTLGQAANEIKRLLEKDYYYAATVRLSLERASNPVAGSISMDGEINRRGPQPLFEGKPLKLSKAITAAGGFGRDANMRKVKVTRVGRDGTSQVFVCDIKAVIEESQVEKDMLLQDGDSVFVPRNFILRN